VSIITGFAEPLARIRSSTSKPFRRGMFTSSRTRSGLLLGERREAAGPVRRLQDEIAPLAQRERDQPAQVGIVVHDEDLHECSAPSRGACRRGRRRRRGG
jgi:hypothetical protein